MADKALLCGINDYKSIGDLRGCLNDVDNMERLLTDVFGFDVKNVKVLKDSAVTKAEVQKQMKWLFRDARKGDRVVFHFSGHGSYTADVDGDEESGADELICLYDMDFDNPGSYLIDDELAEWTKQLPDGVELLVVMDNCHSGTGTRLVMTPVSGKSHRQRPVRVDDTATLKRALTADGSRSPAMTAALASEAVDPTSNQAVRVRFVDPPPEIKQRVEQRGGRRKGWRGLVAADINHVLLAGCRDNQTAADASIEGKPCGAFTHYLCKTLRDGGRQMDRRDLIDKVGRALQDEHFSQVPQLEASNGSGPLFATSAPTITPPVSGGGGSAAAAFDLAALLELLKQILGGGRGLTPDNQKAALDLLKSIIDSRTGAGILRASRTRHLVTVHGICSHPAGYSDPWWSSLRPFTNEFGDGRRDDGGTRHEVLWSDLVNSRAVRARDTREALDRAELSARVRGALEERAAEAAIESAPTIAPAEVARGLPPQWTQRDLFSLDRDADRGSGIFSCVDDFTVYMLNDDVRANVIARFTAVVRPLLEAGTEIDIIAHSWGTVVAYEGLRELADSGLTTTSVRNLFTVGAALAIGPVKGRLRPANRDGRKPAMVKRWINLDAKGDPVGGRIFGRPFLVDYEYVDLDNLGCGWFDAGCAHGSYFKPENVRVNRDIFALFINQP